MVLEDVRKGLKLEKTGALAAHDRQIAEHGGSAGVRDEGRLESALARNHPFVDGDKRTAHVAYRTFLELNGAELVATDAEKYVSILALAEGKRSERGFAAWLRERLRPAARGEVHEPRRAYRARRAASR